MGVELPFLPELCNNEFISSLYNGLIDGTSVTLGNTKATYEILPRTARYMRMLRIMFRPM